MTLDDNGDLRVGGTRLLVDMIVHAFQDGASPETIGEMYPAVTLAQVYSVIAWYLRYQADVDAYLLRRDRDGDAIRSKIEAGQPDLSAFRNRIKARRAAM